MARADRVGITRAVRQRISPNYAARSTEQAWVIRITHDGMRLPGMTGNTIHIMSRTQGCLAGYSTEDFAAIRRLRSIDDVIHGRLFHIPAIGFTIVA